MGHLQIKDLPDDLHHQLRARARQRHMSMRDYVLELLRRDLERPSMDEWLERLRRDRPTDYTGPSGAELVAEGRAELDAKLDRIWAEREARGQSR